MTMRTTRLLLSCAGCLALGCLLLTGGCGSRQGGACQGSAFCVPEQAATPLADNEEKALRSTGAVDANLSQQGMAAVRKEYTRYLRQSRKHMEVSSKRAEPYLAYAQKTFRMRGLPEELAYLAIVESGFRVEATSRAGAAGAWQFIPSTGRHYGLDQNWWTDERLDPYEATEAAADYLQKLHGTFGDWQLALAAYNAGEGKIRRALQGTGGRTFDDIIARNGQLEGKAQLTTETQEYVPRFMAVTKIMRNLPQLGFAPINPGNAPELLRLTAQPGTDLHGLANACGWPWKEFALWNRHHMRPVSDTARDTYVYVPMEKEGEARGFLAMPSSRPYADWAFGTVHRKETWEALARRANVSASRLRAVNPGLDRPAPGAVVFAPRAAGLQAVALRGSLPPDVACAIAPNAGKPAPTERAAAPSPASGQKSHTVRPGETLAGIARQHHVPLWDLMACNAIREPHSLRPGMALRLPDGPAPQAAKAPAAAKGKRAPATYTVRASDSLWRIAQAHHVSVDDLKRWNGVDERHLRVGTRLVVQH